MLDWLEAWFVRCLDARDPWGTIAGVGTIIIVLAVAMASAISIVNTCTAHPIVGFTVLGFIAVAVVGLFVTAVVKVVRSDA